MSWRLVVYGLCLLSICFSYQFRWCKVLFSRPQVQQRPFHGVMIIPSNIILLDQREMGVWAAFVLSSLLSLFTSASFVVSACSFALSHAPFSPCPGIGKALFGAPYALWKPPSIKGLLHAFHSSFNPVCLCVGVC